MDKQKIPHIILAILIALTTTACNGKLPFEKKKGELPSIVDLIEAEEAEAAETEEDQEVIEIENEEGSVSTEDTVAGDTLAMNTSAEDSWEAMFKDTDSTGGESTESAEPAEPAESAKSIFDDLFSQNSDESPAEIQEEAAEEIPSINQDVPVEMGVPDVNTSQEIQQMPKPEPKPEPIPEPKPVVTDQTGIPRDWMKLVLIGVGMLLASIALLAGRRDNRIRSLVLAGILGTTLMSTNVSAGEVTEIRVEPGTAENTEIKVGDELKFLFRLTGTEDEVVQGEIWETSGHFSDFVEFTIPQTNTIELNMETTAEAFMINNGKITFNFEARTDSGVYPVKAITYQIEPVSTVELEISLNDTTFITTHTIMVTAKVKNTGNIKLTNTKLRAGISQMIFGDLEVGEERTEIFKVPASTISSKELRVDLLNTNGIVLASQSKKVTINPLQGEVDTDEDVKTKEDIPVTSLENNGDETTPKEEEKEEISNWSADDLATGGIEVSSVVSGNTLYITVDNKTDREISDLVLASSKHPNSPIRIGRIAAGHYKVYELPLTEAMRENNKAEITLTSNKGQFSTITKVISLVSPFAVNVTAVDGESKIVVSSTAETIPTTNGVRLDQTGTPIPYVLSVGVCGSLLIMGLGIILLINKEQECEAEQGRNHGK